MDQNYTNIQCCELSPKLKLSHDKQVSSLSKLSTIKKQSIHSTNRCFIKRSLQMNYQAKTNKPQISTRTNRVYNLRHNFKFFVASKHKRKSFNKYSMPSPSLSFAQYIALVAICCIVATLTLNFANLLQAPNNFVSANDDITTTTPTGKRFIIDNNNHNYKNHHHQHQQQQQHRYHHYNHHLHQTSPANLQPRNFNNLRHARDSRHKIEQSNEISAHLFTHNHNLNNQHNYNKLKSLSQQVPEQLPIVVSLSDNSYVSASPVESSTITTTTTTTPPTTTTITTSVNEHFSPHLEKKHRTRYLLQQLSSSNSFSSQNNDDIGINPHRLHHKKYHRQRPSMHVYNNDLLINKRTNSINDVERNEEEVVSDEAQQQQQQLTSTSDIPTTATTTQRNRDKYHKNLVQMFDSSDQEDRDQNEAIKHENLDTHYRIKSAAIIKTRESIDMGATFLNYTIVTNLNACLVECWITDSCDTAIYQESPVDFNNNNSNNNYINNYNNNVNINHLPDSFAKSEEHYSLTSLTSKSHIKRPSSSYNSIDEHSIVFGNINDSDKYNIRDIANKNKDDSLGESIVDDSESLGSGLDIKNNSNDDNDVKDDDENDDDDDDNGDDIDPNYDSNNKGSRITLRYETQPREKGFFICYLFECTKPDGFKCQFSAHNYYTSATKRQNMDITAAFTTDPEIGSIEPITTINSIDSNRPFVRNDISDKIISSLNNETSRISQDYYCGPNKFKCISQDQCIPNYSRCDGIFHCSDRSDEIDCNLGDSSVDSIGNHKTLDGYSIVMSDGSLKSDHILERIRSQSDHSKDSLNDKVALKTHPTLVTKYSNSDISNQVQDITKLDHELLAQNNDHILNDESSDVDLRKSTLHNIDPHYSNIISGHSNYHRINGKQQWHDSHIASIRMSQEEYNYGYQNKGNGMNSAIIAIMFGIGVTGMLIVIVGHKMKSIRKRIAYRGRRRSLVPDVDFLIKTMPI